MLSWAVRAAGPMRPRGETLAVAKALWPKAKKVHWRSWNSTECMSDKEGISTVVTMNTSSCGELLEEEEGAEVVLLEVEGLGLMM